MAGPCHGMQQGLPEFTVRKTCNREETSEDRKHCQSADRGSLAAFRAKSSFIFGAAVQAHMLVDFILHVVLIVSHTANVINWQL